MKITMRTLALAAPIALTTLTGCGMNNAADQSPSASSDDILPAGTSTPDAATDLIEGVSSRIYDLIKVKGRASNSRPYLRECPGKDKDKYFRVSHPWSFYPASADDLDVALDNLRKKLPKQGWKIVKDGPDTSINKNVVIIADNDEQKAGVHIAQMKKRNPPKLSFSVVSGCYEVPEGQKVPLF